PRFVEDDRPLDLGPLDAGVDADRRVWTDVGAGHARARADDARADDHAARHLRRRVDLDPPLDSVVAVAERLGGDRELIEDDSVELEQVGGAALVAPPSADLADVQTLA